MELLALDGLTSEQRAELDAGESDPFGSGGDDLTWRDKDRFVVLRADGQLVARAGLLVVDVEVGGVAIQVVGLGDVLVTAARRGSGLGAIVVRGAIEEAARLGPERAMLFCAEGRTAMYGGLGFVELAEPVTVEKPDGTPVEMPIPAMWMGLARGVAWPDGRVRVRGLPF